jgi:hypothetical protein
MSWRSLPVEIISEIGSYLSVYDAISFGGVNKRVNGIMDKILYDLQARREELYDRKNHIILITEANPTEEMLEIYDEYHKEYYLISLQIAKMMGD